MSNYTLQLDGCYTQAVDFRVCVIDKKAESISPLSFGEIEIESDEGATVTTNYGLWIRVPFTTYQGIGKAYVMCFSDNEDAQDALYRNQYINGINEKYSLLINHEEVPDKIKKKGYDYLELIEKLVEEYPDLVGDIDRLKTIAVNTCKNHHENGRLKYNALNYLVEELDIPVDIEKGLIKFTVKQNKIYGSYWLENGTKGCTILSQEKISSYLGRTVYLSPIYDKYRGRITNGASTYPLRGYHVIVRNQHVGFIFSDTEGGYRGIRLIAKEDLNKVDYKQKLELVLSQIETDKTILLYTDYRNEGHECLNLYDAWFLYKDMPFDEDEVRINLYDANYVPSGVGFGS